MQHDEDKENSDPNRVARSLHFWDAYNPAVMAAYAGPHAADPGLEQQVRHQVASLRHQLDRMEAAMGPGIIASLSALIDFDGASFWVKLHATLPMGAPPRPPLPGTGRDRAAVMGH